MSRPVGTSCSIFIGNVPYDAQEHELRELFSKVGEVTSVRVVCDKDTKQPKGYAFCDFSDNGAVQAAISQLNNVEYNGRRLRVDWAERELHTPVGVKSDAERTASRPGAITNDNLTLLAPAPSVADRLARIREQEAGEQARQAAADTADRAEIARLVETLSPTQLFHILGEMQRLTARQPEVARALVAENLQLCLALQHAQFLVGMIDDPTLPTDPEVRERARCVRDTVWSAHKANLQSAVPGELRRSVPPSAQPPPPLQPPPVHMLSLPVAQTGPTHSHMLALPSAPQVAPSTSSIIQVSPQGSAVGGLPPPQQQFRGRTHQLGAPPPADPVVPGAEDQRHNLVERLVQLTPAQIDQLPHDTKIQLLEFLQTLPTRQAQSAAPVL